MTNIQFDTDKYEGHTPAPWRVEGELTEGDDNMGQSGDSTLSIHGDGLYIGEVGADYGIHETIANAQLMADAPEILQALVDEQEKVKHLLSIEKVQEMMTAYGRDLNREIDVLRECIADIANNMEAADDSYMSGFIEDLRKAMKK